MANPIAILSDCPTYNGMMSAMEGLKERGRARLWFGMPCILSLSNHMTGRQQVFRICLQKALSGSMKKIQDRGKQPFSFLVRFLSSIKNRRVNIVFSKEDLSPGNQINKFFTSIALAEGCFMTQFHDDFP
ncbi:MAG: hypothetical protein Q9P14_02165 [candidate division KSB1 bacterium]|nr:hypothetical protein [candidate division KSB1 bacterium]